MSKKRIIIIGSGRGSNAEAIIKNSLNKDSSFDVVSIMGNNIRAGIFEIAKKYKILARYFQRESELQEFLDRTDFDFIALAGYDRKLSRDIVNRYEGKILNIHPSLLPHYKGKDTHKRVLADKKDTHGATVHIVTEELDGGPIIDQIYVSVYPNKDTESSLADRVLEQEHILYSRAIRKFIKDYVMNEEIERAFDIIEGLSDSDYNIVDYIKSIIFIMKEETQGKLNNYQKDVLEQSLLSEQHIKWRCKKFK